ncbi:MAG TPA: alkaline phosphatase family protein, partial [Solirubrobacteraceae bacterium]
GERLVWLSAKGLGTGANPGHTNPTDPGDDDDRQLSYAYLPTLVRGQVGVLRFPSDKRLRGTLSARTDRALRPSNATAAPAGSPIAEGAGKIDHVFYVVRENRTYDQILGDEPRGDGDPKLAIFGSALTPNAHALARRFGLLDHVFANSEASIDGHFWTSAGAVSDYVVKNWHANYGGRRRPYDFGVYAVTWPAKRFLFDQAEKQGISYFNYGEAIAGTIPLPDKDRTEQETQEVTRKLAKSDLGSGTGCYPNDASIGNDAVLSATGVPVEVYDSTLPAGAPPGSMSRVECFRRRFAQQVAAGSVPAFNYLVLSNDHTQGTTPGKRTPQAMIAENDLALGQLVDTISHSPVWGRSLILVIEDDSQDGADHVDAHRIPAFAISPYSRRDAVVHTRYDFLSFIRTLENVTAMKPLTLFDALAVPLYDAFDAQPANGEPYDAIVPQQNLVARNTAASPGARESARLPLGQPDRVPQRTLDSILWRAVHGAGASPPPPGPNASGRDEAEEDEEDE